MLVTAMRGASPNQLWPAKAVGATFLTVLAITLLFGCSRDAGSPATVDGAHVASRTNAIASAVSAAGHPFDERSDPRADIAHALGQAKQDGKFVLLEFGANWCPDCIMLARLFDHASVKPFLDENFHLVKVDVGKHDKNQDLVTIYGSPVAKGIPAIVVLDPDGNVLAATNGGELANARSATVQEILEFLKRWRKLKLAG